MSYRIGKANGRGKCKRCHNRIQANSNQLIHLTGEYRAYSYRYCKKCSEIILKEEIKHLQNLLDRLSEKEMAKCGT